MTSEERESLKSYAEITKGVMILKRGLAVSYKLLPLVLYFVFIIKRCCTILPHHFDQALTILERTASGQLNSNGTTALKDRKMMEEQLEFLEAKRARSAPKWWSEWLALH